MPQQSIVISSSRREISPMHYVPVVAGLGTLFFATLACNLPYGESRHDFTVLKCPNSATDSKLISVQSADTDSLTTIAAYNLALKKQGIGIIETSTIVTRMNGVDKDGISKPFEMAVTQSPIGGTSEFGTQAIVSFKNGVGSVSSLSFNAKDENNVVIRTSGDTGNTIVYLAGLPLKGGSLVNFMQISIRGSVSREEVLRIMESEGNDSRLMRITYINPPAKECCIVEDFSANNQSTSILGELAALDTLETGPLIPILPTDEPPISLPPTKTPLPPATATPTESPSRNAALALGYKDTELKVYETISEGTYSFPGDTVIYNGIIGTKADGSKEMLAIKFSDNPNYLKLSSSEMLEYAKIAKEILPGTPCFQDMLYDRNIPAVGIKGVSTRIIESIDKKDTDGKVILTTQSLLLVSTNDNGYPVLFRSIIQMEDGAKPGEDVFKNGNLAVFYGTQVKSTKVHSVDELTQLVSDKGELIRISTELKLPSTSENNGYSFFYQFFNLDQLYVSAYESFLSSHGVLQTEENPIIILPYGIKIGNQP